MNVVFFVESYGRKANINGVCVKKIADILVEKHHSVTVLTSIAEMGQPDYENIGGVNVYRISRDFLSKMKNYNKVKKSKALKLFIGLYAKVINFFMFVVLKRWPQNSFFTYRKYLSKAKRILKNNPPDMAIGVYFHIDEVLSAVKLKKYFPKVKTGVYMLDAMGGRENPTFLRYFNTQNSALTWESWIMKRADIVFPMQSHKKYFDGTDYSKKLKEKLNYIDIPLLDLGKSSEEIKKNIVVPNRKMKIVYTGYSSRETGSVEYLIKLMESIENVELHIYGRMSKEVLQSVENSQLYKKRVFFYGYLDNCEIIQIQNDADFLATFGSRSECMISGKIFEYMARRKPIIAFYQIENDINKGYLMRYPDVICLKENWDIIDENRAKLKAFIEKKERTDIRLDYLEDEFCKNTPEFTAREIIRLTD